MNCLTNSLLCLLWICISRACSSSPGCACSAARWFPFPIPASHALCTTYRCTKCRYVIGHQVRLGYVQNKAEACITKVTKHPKVLEKLPEILFLLKLVYSYNEMPAVGDKFSWSKCPGIRTRNNFPATVVSLRTSAFVFSCFPSVDFDWRIVAEQQPWLIAHFLDYTYWAWLCEMPLNSFCGPCWWSCSLKPHSDR